MSSTSPNRLNPLDAQPAASAEPSINGGRRVADDRVQAISDAEVQSLRAEKLEAIRAAIEAGAYDSGELLDKAMSRLFDAVQHDEEE